MNYKFNEKNIVVREEGNGEYLLICDGAKVNLCLNESGYDVYNLLNKNNTTEGIVEDMKKIYSNADVNILKKDIEEIMRLFEIYSMVEIEEEKQIKNEKNTYNFNGDLNYKKVSSFILDQLSNDKSIRVCNEKGKKIYYSPLIMRTRVMQNQEFQLFVEGEEGIVAYTAMTSQPMNISNTITFKDIVFSRDLNEDQIIFYLNGLIKKAVLFFNKKRSFKKIRINANSTDKADRLVDILKKVGFVETACLKDETILGDLYFYDYTIK